MKLFAFAVFAITCIGNVLHAEPVAEGTYVDLIVVPVGPVPLAEFEADTPSVPTEEQAKKAAADPSKEKAPPSGGGSGIRVKQQDPSELAPSSVFVKVGSKKYYQIPCSLNAVSSPVRTPISDSEVTLYQRIGDGASSFKELAKVTVPQPGSRYLILLTKPLSEKSWEDPKVTSFAFPAKDRPQLFFVNGSQEFQCGVKVGGAVKALAPLTPLVWQSSPSQSISEVEVSLAMRTPKGQFLSPFYQSYVGLEPNRTSVYIAYGVTSVESFRGGKFATGNIEDGVFRPASLYDVN